MRAFGRLGIPLPGKVSAATGELDYNYGYLAHLMDTDAASLRLPACKGTLRASGLPVREGERGRSLRVDRADRHRRDGRH
jgi:hypothetical protein